MAGIGPVERQQWYKCDGKNRYLIQNVGFRGAKHMYI